MAVWNTQTCIKFGYGWCPIRRRCGHFASTTCSGTSTDFSEDMMVQEVTTDNWRQRLYDNRRTSFVLFHNELDKAQSLHVRRPPLLATRTMVAGSLALGRCIRRLSSFSGSLKNGFERVPYSCASTMIATATLLVHMAWNLSSSRRL